MSRARVNFVSQWYPPEPTSVPEGIAQALRDQDLEVQVLTGIPNYPSGRVHDGYSATQISTETLAGVTVRRTPLYPSHDRSSVKRIANYAAWALSASIFGRSFLRKGDVSLVYASPILAALPAMVAKRLHQVPYVLFIQDIWPDSVFASGFLQRRLISRFAHASLNRFCTSAYRGASSIAVISPGMRELLVSRGVPAGKISLVYNWGAETETGDVEDAPLRKRFGISATATVVLYAGNHGAAQSLDTAISAFADLPKDLDCHLILMGDGFMKSELMAMTAHQGLRHVHFHEAVDFTDMPAYAAAADAQLLCLADRALFEVTMPSKMQAIMSSGRPALVSASGDVSRVAEESGAGLVAPAGDSKALSMQVQKFVKLSASERVEMGHRGKKYYHAHMSRAVGSKRLADLIRNAISRGTEV